MRLRRGSRAEPGPGRSLVERFRYVRRLLGPYARPHRHWLVAGSVGTVFVVACRLAFPWPLRGVLELSFPQEFGATGVVALVPSAGDPIVWLAGAFVLLVLLQGLSELVQRVSFARFAIGTVHDARSAAVGLLTQPGGGARSRDPGDLIARVIGDSARVKAGIKGVLIRLTQNGLFFVGVCAMLLVIDLRLGLVFVAGGTLVAVLAFAGSARVSTIARRLRRNEGRLARKMHRLLSDPELAADEDEARELQETYARSGRAEAKIARLEGLVIWGVHGLLALTACSVLILGVDAVRAGRLEPGDLSVVLFYLVMVHNPTVRVGRQALRLGRVLASAERLGKILETPPEPAVPELVR